MDNLYLNCAIALRRFQTFARLPLERQSLNVSCNKVEIAWTFGLLWTNCP